MMHTKHAVVFKHGYTGLLDGMHLEEIPFRVADFSLEQLLQVALDNHLTHLWVMPDAGITPNREWFNAYDPERWSLLDNWLYHNIEPPPGEVNLLKSVTGWRLPRGGQPQVTLCFAGQASWSWAKRPGFAPQSLLELVQRLEYDLGVKVGTSASTVGISYLKATQPAKTDWLRTPEGVGLAQVPWSDGAKNLIWHRDLTDEEYEKGRYVHKVDINSQFLRACVEEMFGAGELVFTQKPTLEDIKKPGLWYVLISPEGNNPLLPPPVWDNLTMLATPLVKLLQKMGYQVQILEGCFFPECHGVLKHWAENLWTFRQNARGWPEVYDSYKEIYTSALGLTRSDKITEENSFKFRPDINAQVVAGARAAMMYRIMKYARLGCYPVMCYIDSLLYVSEHENIEVALPGILDHQHSLGGFHHEWSLPVNGAVREVLGTGTLPRAKKLEALNTWAEEYEVVR